MKTLEDIQNDIRSLPHGEYLKLVHWLSERDWKEWDGEIARDSRSGRLDFLIEEAVDEKERGKLRDLL